MLSGRQPRQRLERRVGDLHLLADVLPPVCDDQGAVEIEGQAEAENGEHHLVLGCSQVGPATAAKQETEKNDLRRKHVNTSE